MECERLALALARLARAARDNRGVGEWLGIADASKGSSRFATRAGRGTAVLVNDLDGLEAWHNDVISIST